MDNWKGVRTRPGEPEAVSHLLAFHRPALLCNVTKSERRNWTRGLEPREDLGLIGFIRL